MLAVEQVERVLQTLQAHWLACTLVMIAACLMSTFKKPVRSSEHKARQATSQTTPRPDTSSLFTFLLGFAPALRPAETPAVSEPPEQPPFSPRRSKKKMRYHKTARHPKTKKAIVAPTVAVYALPRTRQPYDAFLVLDLEGTCELGTDFSYPNEIIVRDIISRPLPRSAHLPSRNFPCACCNGQTVRTTARRVSWSPSPNLGPLLNPPGAQSSLRSAPN